MNDIDSEFYKIFGDMYLSKSKTALRVFEYGYKAGAAAENEACAKVCDGMDHDGVMVAADCAAAIRERMK